MISITLSILLFLMTIFASRTNNSMLLMFVPIIVIGISVILFWKTDKKYYPYVLYCIAISLLLQTTLLSNYLTGSDIIAEHWIFKGVINSGFWDPSSSVDLYNSSSFLVLLSPLFSIILGTSGIWIFKIISPIIYAFSPVILYLFYKKFLNDKQALLGSLLFISIPVFFLEMPSVIRGQSAQFLFIASLYILFDNVLSTKHRIPIFILLSVTSLLAYYTIGMIMLICLSIIVFVVLICKISIIRNFLAKHFRLNGLSTKFIVSSSLFVSIICIAYYAFAASGVLWAGIGTIIKANIEEPKTVISLRTTWAPLDGGVNIIVETTPANQTSDLSQNIERPDLIRPDPKYATPTFFDRLFGKAFRSPLIRTALGLDFFEVSIFGKVFRVLQYAIELLMMYGVILVLCNRKRFNIYYFAILLVFATIIGVYILSPIISGYMGVTRFYHMMMIIVIPIVVYSGERVFSFLLKKMQLLSCRYSLNCFAALIILPQFIFNSGLVFELAKFSNTDKPDIPYSIAMSNYRMDIGGIFSDKDFEAAEFLRKFLNGRGIIFTDFYSTMVIADALDFRETGEMHERMILLPWGENIPDGVFIFLRERNINTRILSYYVNYGLRRLASFEEVDFDNVLKGRTILYNNGAMIYSPIGEYWQNNDSINDENMQSISDKFFLFYTRPMLYFNYWKCSICGKTSKYDAIKMTDSNMHKCVCGYVWKEAIK